MSRPVIAVIFLVTCLLLGAISLIFIEMSCNNLIDVITNTQKSIISKDMEFAGKTLNETVDMWEKYKPFLNLLLGQGETIEIRGNLNKAIYFFNCGDLQTSLLHLQECKTNLNRIISSNEPTFSTVF